MYGRNTEIGTADLSFLIGATLTQVCLGAHDLGLSFSTPPSCGVMISSSFGIQTANSELIKHELTMGHLLRPFLNRDLIAATWAEMGTLILTFDGNDQIHIFDDSDQYESYVIGHKGLTIVI
jgi:hypothetical protein